LLSRILEGFVADPLRGDPLLAAHLRAGPGRYRSPRHEILFNTKKEVSKGVSADDDLGSTMGLADIARHVMIIEFNTSKEVSNGVYADDDEAIDDGSGKYCSPRHRFPGSSRNESTKCVYMT
jgi:hypothetical protein